MDKPYISVIVPAYNIEQYIEQCIQSILNQTYTNFELIIVDDGSTDQTGKLCDQYAQKDPHVSVIHKENGGLVSARKAGLKISKGEYISYVDGDDWIEVNALDTLYRSVINEQADIIIADFIYVFSNRVEEFTQNFEFGTYTKEQLIAHDFNSVICLQDYFAFGLQPSLCSKLFRKDILFKNQMAVDNSIRLGEDAACLYPCIFESKKIVYLKNNFLYHYRMRDLSISHSIVKTYYTKEILLLIDHINSNIESIPNNSQLLLQLWLYYCYMVDNMITSHLSFFQIFLCNDLYQQCKMINNHSTWLILSTKYAGLRTSSRMKRIIRLIDKDSILHRIDLFLFITYERCFSKH